MYESERDQLNAAVRQARESYFNNAGQAKAKEQCADQQVAVQSDCVGYSPRPTVIDHLRAQSQLQYQLGRDAERAASILNAHPEFEDLIWLIRSGLV